MNLQLIYAWSKKIHKWSMWGVVALGSWMMLSGFLMHEELGGEALLSPTNMLFFRTWHNNVSQYFLVFLLIQMATGLIIWGVPKILMNRKVLNPPVQTGPKVI